MEWQIKINQRHDLPLKYTNGAGAKKTRPEKKNEHKVEHICN